MTPRERRVAGLFFISLGALGLLAAALSLVNVAAPPPTTSLLRAGLADLLRWAFGETGGRVAFHLTFGAGSAFMLWLGIKTRQF